MKGMVHARPVGVDSAAAHRPVRIRTGRLPDLDCVMAGGDDLNWNDLRFFLRAAQAGTLAGAARAMEVDHSTIGRRLSALERSLGAPLVIRAPDGLASDTAGREPGAAGRTGGARRAGGV